MSPLPSLIKVMSKFRPNRPMIVSVILQVQTKLTIVSFGLLGKFGLVDVILSVRHGRWNKLEADVTG